MAMKSLNEKWLSIVQSTGEKGENEIGGFSTITLPLSLFRDSNSNTPSASHSGGRCTSCGCSWATGAHMTELSTNGAGAHVAGLLGMSRGSQLTKGTDVLGALGTNVVGGLALEASYHSRCGRGGVGDLNGIRAGASSHNHFQFSGESNPSRAHCQSSSSVNSRPTSLSQSSVPSVTFLGGEGVWSAKGKWVCTVGQLGRLVDCGIGGGKGFGGRGGSSGAGGVGISEGRRGSMVFFLLLNCSLHCVIRAVVGLPLSL